MTKPSCKILTVSGLLIDPFDLQAEEILIEDIAHSLSLKCRWMGHTPGFLSVAQHSIFVAASRIVPDEFKLQAIMHDAAEAYFGDIPRPFLALPEFTFIREAQEEATRRIFAVFHIPFPLSPAVVRSDDLALSLEKNNILTRASTLYVPPDKVERAFLGLFERYYQNGKSKTPVR